MNYSYEEWRRQCLQTKESFALLSFPAIQKLGVTVEDVVKNSDVQADVIRKIMEECPGQAAYIGMMDLSVEAEAFGMDVVFSSTEVPNVKGKLIANKADAEALVVPSVSEHRTQVYVDGILKVAAQANDKPVFAGVIGPFSLAGRLVDVTEIMIQAMMDPDMVHTVLKKASEFIENYILAYKQSGASGVIVAEPLAGLLSGDMVQAFSSDYLKGIIDRVQDDTFSVFYHNCGPSTTQTLPEIFSIGAHGYHFGNAIDLEAVLKHSSEDQLIMGNLDPVHDFCDATAAEMDQKVHELFDRYRKYPNWLISSGCDIPHHAKWANIEQYFASIKKWRD